MTIWEEVSILLVLIPLPFGDNDAAFLLLVPQTHLRSFTGVLILIASVLVVVGFELCLSIAAYYS